MKIGEDDHKTFMPANLFAENEERLLIYVSGKGQKSAFLRVLASLWLQT